jgi:hypothetical protein
MFDLSFRKLAFYSLFETGKFIMAPYKVVWKEIASELACAVQGPYEMNFVENRNVIPDHKLVILPCEIESEAHFICGLLNSALARFVAITYIPGAQISTHILQYIKIPIFDPAKAAHAEMADLGARCHIAARTDEVGALAALEAEVDIAAARLWGITDAELLSIQNFLNSTAGESEPVETELG